MSSLNHALLLAAQSAGATATDLPTALRQALLASGATSSTAALNDLWGEYLVSKGYSVGSNTDRLGAYLKSLGYSGSLNDMMFQSAQALDLFGVASYPLSFANLGISATGFVFDGSVSRFCTDSAGTTLCSASGSDPVGYIEDLSGNENHIIQPTSTIKPVYYTNNGVQAARSGQMSFVRTMHPTTDLFVTAAHTVFAVFCLRTTVNNGGAVLCTYTGNGWGSGGYFRVGNPQSSSDVVYIADAVSTGIALPGGGFSPTKILEVVRNTPTNSNVYSYDTTGALRGSAVGITTQTATPANKLTLLGYDSTACDVIETAFLMYVNAALDSTQRDTIRAHIVANFGAWA